MSEVTTPAGTVAPAAPAPVAPVAPVAAAPVVAPVATPPVAPAPAVDPNAEPAWLAGRLTRAEQTARNALLQELGVEDPEAAKAAIAAAKAAADAKKTAEERAAELDAKLRGTQTEAQQKDAIIKEHAARMLMALSPEQQKAITDFAGDNPALQLKAIHSFAPTWAKQEEAREISAAAAAKAAAEIAAIAAPPATTSPAPTAPGSVSPGSPPAVRELYQSARARNPFAAAAYGLANPQAYENKQ